MSVRTLGKLLLRVYIYYDVRSIVMSSFVRLKNYTTKFKGI